MGEEGRKVRGTPLVFMILGMLGLVATVSGGFLFGHSAHAGQALIGVVMYLVLFVWTIYRVLTGRSGHRMLGSLFAFTLVYAFCIFFYAPGQYAVWVILGCLGALTLTGVASYYVDWVEKRKAREIS